MANETPITKISFNQWLKHPTTVLLILVTFVAYGITWKYVNSQLENVKYLKERIEVLEDREAKRTAEMEAYIRTIIYKDMQIKGQSVVIDSLKGGNREKN